MERHGYENVRQRNVANLNMPNKQFGQRLVKGAHETIFVKMNGSGDETVPVVSGHKHSVEGGGANAVGAGFSETGGTDITLGTVLFAPERHAGEASVAEVFAFLSAAQAFDGEEDVEEEYLEFLEEQHRASTKQGQSF